jgi:hypothetical protein
MRRARRAWGRFTRFPKPAAATCGRGRGAGGSGGACTRASRCRRRRGISRRNFIRARMRWCRAACAPWRRRTADRRVRSARPVRALFVGRCDEPRKGFGGVARGVATAGDGDAGGICADGGGAGRGGVARRRGGGGAAGAVRRAVDGRGVVSGVCGGGCVRRALARRRELRARGAGGVGARRAGGGVTDSWLRGVAGARGGRRCSWRRATPRRWRGRCAT